MMVFSTKTEIRGYFLRSQLYFPIANHLKQVIGVGFDGHYVYWTDIFSGHESIVRSAEDGSNREVSITPTSIQSSLIENIIWYSFL